VLNQILTEILTKMSGSQKIFKRICLTTLVLFLTLNGNKIAVHGSSSGSPVQACVDMVPDHHVDAQTSASPFVTTPSVVGIFLSLNFILEFLISLNVLILFSDE
jgi:hypothetical protein